MAAQRWLAALGGQKWKLIQNQPNPKGSRTGPKGNSPWRWQ